jgi:hypothetical protein
MRPLVGREQSLGLRRWRSNPEKDRLRRRPVRSSGDELRYQRVAVGPARCTDELCRYTFEPPILAAFCSSFALYDYLRSRCLTSLLNSRTARRRPGNWTLLRLAYPASIKLRQSTHPSSNLRSTNFHYGVAQEHCVLRLPPERVTRNYSMVGETTRHCHQIPGALHSTLLTFRSGRSGTTPYTSATNRKTRRTSSDASTSSP